METLTILLSEPVSRLAAAEAQKRGVEASALCAGIVTEHFLGNGGAIAGQPPLPAMPRGDKPFEVRKHFVGYPGLSVELAQIFVDAVLRMPQTRVFASERGVGFSPNFVFIPYLRKRLPGGIGVSFYGSPERHSYSGLVPGRNPNYSRAVIATRDDLEQILPEIKRSYELKFQ
jgi:hypothetical protein